MFTGSGTAVNIVTVLVGSGIGVALGHRLPERVRRVVTDGLGLVTLLVAGTAAVDVLDPDLSAATGSGAPMLVVLGAVLVGGIVGAALDLDGRLLALGHLAQRRLTRRTAPPAGGPADAPEDADRFAAGFVAASILFCTGPLTVLGSLNDGLGAGADQLYLKAVLDGFAAIAFAATFGWGVAASALTVLVVQGGLTLVGVVAGDVLPAAHVAALGAVGGVLLIGVALRLLDVKQVAVASLLPALVVAPALVELVVRLR
ncbi:DUF554 domain-containing protein [Nocardioides sp. ChNu-153]|uniref:DUF554 domain-containing protein n=1 Tax=unclassified Nocardioides TaxID=2615069 RepID=UPI002404A647|nr:MULTISPECIES: DUF554 domain-containing protein [unclassified Nocardioides]MDF9715612.1 DUF554 domain-containing protein [Nocardioides sp. ChNu-99]MDN7121284.1 DUF554 domain-containing protein [Nocardioides sp. ChNu-153]